MPSAIVTGATGILGREIVNELAKDPTTWQTIHALSRSQKEEYPRHVKHDTIDLTGDAKQMASQLDGVEGEYVFFAAYLQGNNEQENWDFNGAMLKNFLTALETTGALAKVKRVVLVTGCKQYGLHLGRPRNPMIESDPRIDGAARPPNFYYIQQDILKDFSKSSNWDWVVTYPNDVIGLASNNFMNLATPLALYALVCKELGGDMPWPGSELFYHCATTFTDSKLHARFCVWAAQQPQCSNQAYNVVNGDTECWEHLWPNLAAYFGTHVPPDQFARPTPAELQSSTQLQDEPPIVTHADAAGLRGSDAVQPSKVEARIDVAKWAQREDVKAAWDRIAHREGIDRTTFGKAPWWFLQFVVGRNFNILISQSKARQAGWTGYQDTWEAFARVFGELEGVNVLPKRQQ